MAGYWGGVTPTAGTAMERYEPALAYPVQSPGVTGNQPDIVMDSLSVLGLGLVHPRRVRDFYGELHAYLASCGVDGVKVDVQNIIETLGAGHGGRVAITRAYHRALEASVARSFPDNGCISIYVIARACIRRRSTTARRGPSVAARYTSATSRGTTTSSCSGSSCSPTAP
ncbi:Stachyose synthase [Zea mays]|uniref:Stachyose synthase n=1 Tax=Zea mays TaxID=4577 RepID=A0A1D6HVY2_MAIZE|nr:Stachyose synthase [Zea mays]